MPVQKFNVKDAKQMLMEKADELSGSEPFESQTIIICQEILLKYPGRLKHGDYVLRFNGEKYSHESLCRKMIKDINAAPFPKKQYRKWMDLLEDVYENGTTNISDSDYSEFLNKSLVFWITLQEEINYPKGMGRKHPFCRYAEAIGSTQTSAYTFDDILPRIYNQGVNPRKFEKLVFPNCPKFYKWY